MAGFRFDYETKVWGGDMIRIKPKYFRASRLFWALKAIKKVKKGGRVLDVGCGVGDFLESFNYYRKDLKLEGIDLSKKAIGEAKKRNLKVNFRVGDAQKLPFKDNFFDGVVAFDIVEHVEEPQKVLNEMIRVVKPGGVIHVYIPTEGSLMSLEGILVRLGWKGKEIYGGHPHWFTPRQARGMVKKAGIKVFRQVWGDHLFHQIYEVIYFSFLLIRGKNAKRTIEGYLAEGRENLVKRGLRALKNVLASLAFIETMIFFWLPGMGIHFSGVKEKNEAK